MEDKIMKKINVKGTLFATTIKVNGQNIIEVYECGVDENINDFAQAVFKDVENSHPNYTEIWCSAYGDPEAYPIIEVDTDPDDPIKVIGY